nr:hypothetical protein [Tanacetum cinerariifolium]
MTDNRTMAEMLRAPTEGCAEAIVVPPILAEQFELKHWAARRWLEKEPPHSITTWDDLVSKFINEFFPPPRATNLRNEISNFQQKFDESFHEAWERYKDLLHAYQDSLNAAVGGNLLEKSPQDALTIIENKSKQTSVVNTAMTAMLKKFQSNPPPAQVKAIEEICVTCGGSGTPPGNTIANPKGKLKAITIRNGLVTEGPTVPNPPKSVNPEEDECVEEMYTDPDHAEYNIKVPPPPPQEKDDIQIQKFWNMFKQLHLNITLAEALVLMPKYQKMLKALLFNKEKLQELANTPLNENSSAVILKNLPEKLRDPGKFLIPCVFSELKCKALADLGAKLANRTICTPDGIARDIFVLVDIDSFNDIHPHFDDDPLSGSTTYSANSLLEEFADELALITYPSDYDDNRACDIEYDIREIEFLLYQGEDSDFKDFIDQSVLTHCDDLFVDPTPKMFTDEQPPDYSFPPRFDVYPDDFLEIESDANFDDNSFDSKGEKIKESELLIDQLDLPCDILSEYDSFNSRDFSRDDVLPSPNNDDKVFNTGILSHEKSVKIITRVTQEKKLAVSYASWLFEDLILHSMNFLFSKKSLIL